MNRGPRCYGPDPVSPTHNLTHETEFGPDVKLGTWHFGVHYWCLRPPIWYFLDFNSATWELFHRAVEPGIPRSGLTQVDLTKWRLKLVFCKYNDVALL